MTPDADDPDRPSSPSTPPSDRERRPLDRRLLFGLVLSAVFVIGVGAIAVIRSHDDGCGSWEEQLDELSRRLTRHRLLKGQLQQSSLEELRRLALPCKRVALARDACVEAYVSVSRAEEEQGRAKAVLQSIEKAVTDLDEPWRSAAKLRLLDNEPLSQVASALEVEEPTAKRQVDEALAKIGPDRLEALHRDFEIAVERANQYIKRGAIQNEECDHLFKLLLEEGQQR